MKILASLGTHTQDFSRMSKAVDDLAGRHPEYEIIVQTGVTNYKFQNKVFSFDYCPKDKMNRYMDEADLLILQGGWGGIEEAVDKGKRCVVIPRIEGLEHIHNQEQLVRKMDSLGCIVGCFDIDQLDECILKALAMKVQPITKGDASNMINEKINEWFSKL